jgi:hypothetical protein
MKLMRIFLETAKNPLGSVEKYNSYDLDLDQDTILNNSWIITILDGKQDYPIPRPQQSGASSKAAALSKVIEYYKVEAIKLGLSFRTENLPESFPPQ